MKKFKFLLIALIAMIATTSCKRVAPNYAGVLMENYGKDGKKRFQGCVWPSIDMGMGYRAVPGSSV